VEIKNPHQNRRPRRGTRDLESRGDIEDNFAQIEIFMSRTPNPNKDFAAIRKAETGGPNYGVYTDDIIARLTQWQALCDFTVTDAGRDTVDITFNTLPKDMDAFVKDLYEFCPDLVDQGTGCVDEMVESGEELSPEIQKLIEGIDFTDENFGLEILKRELQQKKSVTLWWD